MRAGTVPVYLQLELIVSGLGWGQWTEWSSYNIW